jgi:hypothetical protein
LYISSHICWVGITPASESFLALTSTMTLMFRPHLRARYAPLWDLLSKLICRALTPWSSGPGRNRHTEQNFSKELLRSQSLNSCRLRKPPLPLVEDRRQLLPQPEAGFEFAKQSGQQDAVRSFFGGSQDGRVAAKHYRAGVCSNSRFVVV